MAGAGERAMSRSMSPLDSLKRINAEQRGKEGETVFAVLKTRDGYETRGATLPPHVLGQVMEYVAGSPGGKRNG
jgi:hypothetical protein